MQASMFSFVVFYIFFGIYNYLFNITLQPTTLSFLKTYVFDAWHFVSCFWWKKQMMLRKFRKPGGFWCRMQKELLWFLSKAYYLFESASNTSFCSLFCVLDQNRRLFFSVKQLYTRLMVSQSLFVSMRLSNPTKTHCSFNKTLKDMTFLF